MGRVQGKVAFITGAARGQGRSHAFRLAEEGADIIAVDVCRPIRDLPYPPATQEDLDRTAEGVRERGRRVVTGIADVRDRAALEKSLIVGVDTLGRLDVVVANAGVCIPRAWDEITVEQWRETIDINLTGVWNTLQLSAPYLVKQRSGSIIVTSSASGLRGTALLGHYVASKHAIVGLARNYALELGEYGVRVNTLHPLTVNTPMIGCGEGRMAEYLSARPRLVGTFSGLLPDPVVEPVDISNAVVYLASDESRHVTASAMTIDTGNTQH